MSEQSFRFTTGTAIPLDWEMTTQLNASNTPWWIQREEIRRRDNKIRLLEARLVQHRLTND